MMPASIQTQASGAIQRRRQSVDAEVSDHIHLIDRQAYWHCGTRPFRIRTLTARPEESTAALATGSANAFLYRPVRIVSRRFHSLLRSLQRNYSGCRCLRHFVYEKDRTRWRAKKTVPGTTNVPRRRRYGTDADIPLVKPFSIARRES
jgi:hypothetical protein